MGDVLEFPSAQAQGLAYLDRQLRELLAARGADPALIDFAAEELTRTYTEFADSEDYSFRVSLPDGLNPEERDSLQRQIDAGLEGIRSQNHALLIRLVAQLVLAQLKLFQLERSR